MSAQKTKAGYLGAILALVVLLVAGAGVALAHGDDGNGMSGRMMNEGAMWPMMGDRQMGSMMHGGGTGSMMGSFDEKQPFDVQFIDQMIMHHQGAIISSEHMISDSGRLELRELAENIQESQSEQIDQMRKWRKEWYPDAERTFGMMDPTRMGEAMPGGMMGGSMRGMMGGDTTDTMFLGMMIPHHQLGVDMAERALKEAEHPELKELAQTIIEEQSAEIELMKEYLEEIEGE